MVNAQPVEQPNAQQTAYEYIKEEILALRLAPNARLNAIELASRLELSRTPVREALSRLEQDGLADRDVGGGFRVHALSLKEIVDTYKAREALEVEAALEARQGFPHGRAAQVQARGELDRVEADVRGQAEGEDLLLDVLVGLLLGVGFGRRGRA